MNLSIWFIIGFIWIVFLGPMLAGGLLTLSGTVVVLALAGALGAFPLLPVLLVALFAYRLHRSDGISVNFGSSNNGAGSSGRERACPYCESSVGTNEVICPNCYNDLKVNCDHCGAVLDVERSYCPRCGRRVVSTSVSSASVNK